MKKNLLLLIVFCLATITQAQQPYAPIYHPEDLKNWVAGEDPNDFFNRATISLQPRFVDQTIKANPNATFSDAMIAADLTLAKDCSKGYAQGRNSFDEMYIFNYWQYTDKVIWWGGSAGEGVFICPTATAIDVAHKNGVKILGNIFFAPTAFGGQEEWVTQTLEKNAAGDYIIADKLIEVANYFGFDGWFLNEETKHFSDKAEWENFCAYFSANSDLELQMYNATASFSATNGWMLRNGSGEATGTSYFVNYGGTGGVDTHVTYAESIGVEKWDLFYGINQGTSAFSGSTDINRILSKDNHKASLAPFLERAIWRLNGTDDQYDLDKDYINSFFKTANKYWVGTEQPNPSVDRATAAWPGMANYVPSRTIIQSKPFVTTFNSGYGIRRNVKGEDKGVSGQKWVHQGIQDILPTWRWWWLSPDTKELSSELTLDDAFEGGTSLKIEGDLNANDANEVRLFKTKITIESGDVFKLVFKNSVAGASNIQVGLAFTEDNNAFSYVSAGTASAGWDVKELDLSAFAGKTLSMISLKYESTTALAGFTSYIGQLGVFGADALTCSGVSNIASQNELGTTEGDIRLIWDAATGDVLHYNVYMEQGGTKHLVGQTPSTAFFVPEIVRTGPSESGVKVYVASVAKDFEESAEVSIEQNWGQIELPGVKIKASSTFAVTGTEISFTAIATNYPSSYTWTAPEGVEVVSEIGNKAVYRFPAEGTFDIAVSVSNQSGATDLQIEDLVTIDNTNVLTNVILNKTVIDHNGHFGSEKPENLIDGIIDQGGSAKWCFGGTKEHFTIVDLGQAYNIFNTKLLDAKVNEDAENLKNYKILVSSDNSEGSYVELFNEDGNRQADDIKIDHFKGTVARFVKIVPYDKVDEITIRLWELEVYGLVGPLSLDQPDAIVLDKDQTKQVTLNFDLGGEVQAENFEVMVYPFGSGDAELISISDVSVQASSVSFNVNTASYGSANFVVKLNNGEWFAMAKGKVSIENPSWENLALNKTGEKGSDKGYGEEVNDVSFAIDGDMDSYWVSKLGCITYKVDLEEQCSVYKIYSKFTQGMGSYNGNYNNFPGEVKIRYSVDGTNWSEMNVPVMDGLLDVNVNNLQVQYVELVANLGGYSHIGLYEVILTGSTGSATSVGNLQGSSFNVSVSPNPLVDNANVNVYMATAGKVSVDIYNMMGTKEAQVFNNGLPAGSHVLSIAPGIINNLNIGMYFVVVNTIDGKRVIKITKK